ncbi:MAG TPA: YfiR family protein [Burkholderiaceae bacterium]|jgi:hypothetical protein|nr:YfiR family protein [Burkholderiaceae bacterium]
MASARVSRRPLRLGAALTALVCAFFCLSSPRPAQAEPLAEYEIKAAFIYNFAKFVQWPATAFAQPQAPLMVCVIGDDAFGSALDTIDHKVAQGHELRLRRRVHLEDARSCHILFVARTERARLTQVVRAVSGLSVLTISDMDRFAEAGGVIGLYELDSNVHFSINQDQARRALLQINSQLLKLARIVQTEVREDGQ